MIRPWQDFVVKSALSFFGLFICNIMILVRLCQMTHKRHDISSANAKDTKVMRSLTFMLLTVNFFYLLCISPLQIMYLIDKSDPYGQGITQRWQAIAALRWAFAIDVYYLNHAINFILYCISGSEFRKALKMLFVKMCCGQKEQTGAASSKSGGETSMSNVPPPSLTAELSKV